METSAPVSIPDSKNNEGMEPAKNAPEPSFSVRSGGDNSEKGIVNDVSNPKIHVANNDIHENNNGDGGSIGTSFAVAGQKRDAYGFAVHPNGNKSAPGDIVNSTSDGSFVKLFVGYVPKTVTEDEVRSVFAEHGNIVEVALVRDKISGQQKGCCFVKYATVEEADKAIKALHNIYTLPGGIFPVQVKYADGELERLGTMEHKLFVGSINKQATEKEIEEIFARFGEVESIYIMKDELKQSRGSAFVKYVSREMAMAAIQALDGTYKMEGCEYPLIVRIAEPKRRRVVSNGPYPNFQGHGSSSGPYGQTGPRPTVGAGWGSRPQRPPTNWQPAAPGPRVQSHVVPRPNGTPFISRGGPNETVSRPHMVGPLRGQVNDTAPQHIHAPPQMTAPQSQGLNPAPLQHQSQAYSQQWPQMQPKIPPPQQQTHSFGQQFPQSQQQLQAPVQQQTPSYSQNFPQVQQKVQPPMQMQQGPQTQSLSNPQLQHVQHGQLQQSLTSLQNPRPPIQQQAAPAPQWAPNNVQQYSLPLPVTQNMQQQSQPLGQLQQPQVQPQQQPLLQSQSQVQPQQHSLIQPVQFQTPSLQASFYPHQQYSSNQQYPSFQQQQPSWEQQQQPPIQAPIQTLQNQVSSQHQPWMYTGQTNAALTATAATATNPSSSTQTTVVTTPNVEDKAHQSSPGTCTWTEYTSPEGYKYYYNSVTRESKWEKPVELVTSEQQKQTSTQAQQPQLQQMQVQQAAITMQPQPQVGHQRLTAQQPARLQQPQSHPPIVPQQLPQTHMQQQMLGMPARKM